LLVSGYRQRLFESTQLAEQTRLPSNAARVVSLEAIPYNLTLVKRDN
jgi:hypothetical protein